MEIFWELHQNYRIAQAKDQTRRVRREVDNVEDKLDKTLLVCQALWTLLREKLGVTEDELLERVTQLDLADGELDGKARRTATRCPACKRTVTTRYRTCIYCGAPIEFDPFNT